MKKVYIAGPYRGDNSWAVELNIRRAEELGMRVAQMGALPVIPHTMYRYWDGTLDDEFWLACGRELLELCDAVCVVADSDGSQGTQAELEHACKMMIRVYHSGSKSQMDALRKLVAQSDPTAAEPAPAHLESVTPQSRELEERNASLRDRVEHTAESLEVTAPNRVADAPAQERLCGTCRHEHVPSQNAPCRSCLFADYWSLGPDTSPRWEPKDDAV